MTEMTDRQGNAITPELLESLGRRLAEESGVPLLTGPATIRLIMRTPHAITPLGAVDDAMLEIARTGLSDFAWLVTDDISQESWWVFDGRILTDDELAMTPAGEDEDDEEGDKE